MKIVVVGGGKVGEVICQELSTEENDIVLIDKNQDLIDRLLVTIFLWKQEWKTVTSLFP